MKRLFVCALLFIIICVFQCPAFARSYSLSCDSGSATWTEYIALGGRFMRVEIAWTSTAAGAVDCDCNLEGILVGVDFLCTNTSEPTDNYDVEIFDYTGINDLLDDAGANISQLDANENQDTWYRCPLNVDGTYRVFINEAATLSITNAGATKQGTVVLKFKYQ